MQFKNYNIYFFFLILFGVIILAYFILKPFLVPILIAAILARLFSPAYRFFLGLTKKKGIASGVVCLIIALLIIAPLFAVTSLVVNEIQMIIDNFSQKPESVRGIINKLSENLSALSLSKIFGSEKIASEKIIKLSPLRNKYENILIDKFNSITRATIKGTTLIAIIQGFLGSVLFLATGVSSPILLGIIMTISSVIPSIGSGLVWLPVGIVMIILGHFSKGIIILLVGGLFISTIDNFIRPKLVGKDTQMHPLLILFSTLGGIVLFGISGFIVGPIVMSLFVALWDIYALEFKAQLEEYNE